MEILAVIMRIRVLTRVLESEFRGMRRNAKHDAHRRAVESWLVLLAISLVAFLCSAARVLAEGAPEPPNPKLDLHLLRQRLSLVLISIDDITPQDVWEKQGFVVDYTVSNLTTKALTGSVAGSFQGRSLDANGSVQVALAPLQSVRGQLRTKANFGALEGIDLLQVRLEERVCNPSKMGGVVPDCRQHQLASDSRPIDVHHVIDILTSTDLPDTLPDATGSLCGDTSLGTAAFYGTDPLIPDEWADTPNGTDVPVTGRVINTIFNPPGNDPILHPPGNDIAWDHPFGNDFWFNTAPDSQYVFILNDISLFGKGDCTKKNPEADGDTCDSFALDQRNGVTPTAALHTEIESGLIPLLFRPLAGDRIYERGRRILDCGHVFDSAIFGEHNYSIEIHPPTVVAAARFVPSKGIHSTFIAMPYRTNQTYTSGLHFNTAAIGELSSAFLAGFTPLNLLANIDTVTMNHPVTAHYTLTLPPMSGQVSAILGYHFEVRPGVTAVVSPRSANQADVTVTIDPATYSPPPAPQCSTTNLSSEDFDRQAKWPTGSLRTLINGIIFLLGLGANPVGSGASLNQPVSIKRCSIASQPLPPESVMDNSTHIADPASPFPAYGWVNIGLTESPKLIVNRSGAGNVFGTGGINCGSACVTSYPLGTRVTLIATPEVGWTFSGWSGACFIGAFGQQQCTITMNRPLVVNATFTHTGAEQRKLTIALKRDPSCAPNADGTVNSTMPPLNCVMSQGTEQTCSSSLDAGSTVALTALPGSQSKFLQWAGACSGSSSCSIIMTNDAVVTATFCGLIQ
jgi:hypothetical protein